MNTIITTAAIVVAMLMTTTIIQPQQQVYAATYKDPLGRFTIGYRDGWIPSFNSTRNSTNVVFKEKNELTHIFSVLTLPKIPLGVLFATFGIQSTMMRFGYWITQPSFKLSLDSHETNDILVSGVLPQKQKFESLMLISEIGNDTIMSTYLSKTPDTFMQEVNDTAIPMVKSFHWLGSLQ
jgi:hypothetical protein